MRKWARPIWNKVWSCVRHFIKILWNNLKRLFISHGKWHHFPYCEIVFIRQICMKGFEEKSDNDGIHTSIIFEISNEFLDGELIWSPKDDKLVIHCFKIGYPHLGNEISMYRVSCCSKCPHFGAPRSWTPNQKVGGNTYWPSGQVCHLLIIMHHTHTHTHIYIYILKVFIYTKY